MLTLKDIQIRDPFILNDKENNQYVLYGTTDKDPWDSGESFLAYTSKDLKNWHGPITIFEKNKYFWGVKNYWAPEVWYHQNKYYLLATFCGESGNRGTQILSADHPTDVFKPHSEKMITPENWMCLDGTLHVDLSGSIWLVFCREWVEVHDGEMYAVQLSSDLTTTIGEPQLLFKASEAPWTTGVGETGTDYITDGPFITRLDSGKLVLLWSSFNNGLYNVGQAISETDSILGPWSHDVEPLIKSDAGHCMVFDKNEDERVLVMHGPNKTPNERVNFYPIRYGEDKIYLA